MRVRLALELGIIALLTVAFLTLAPSPILNTGTYVGLALVGLGLIAYGRKDTEEKIWGPPESPDFDRVRRCAIGMSALTIPPVIIFLIIGIVARYWLPQLRLTGAPCPMFSLHFFMALLFYLPWALLQQTLFQFYLLGRLRALLPFASPLLLSTLNGIAYGLVHLPSGILLTLVTIIGGIFWSYSYYRDRYVLPIALSHALLGTTFYYWIYGRDIIGEILTRMGS
jgi:hypothetical protein